MMSVTPQRESRALAAFEKIPAIAGSFAILVGVLALIGWWRDIDSLRTIIPGLIPTIPNAAVAFVIAGTGLLCARLSEHDDRFRQATTILGAALATLGTLFFFERVTNINLGIDLLLFGDKVRQMAWQPPGLPAINTTIVMILNGLALILVDSHSYRGRRPSGNDQHRRRGDLVHRDRRVHVRRARPVQRRSAHGDGVADRGHVLHRERGDPLHPSRSRATRSSWRWESVAR